MAVAQAGSSKMTTNGTLKRLATSRELFYGLRSDGTVLRPCINIRIHCRQQITSEQFESCVQHFNRNVPFFREYLTEGKDNNFWLAIQNNPSYSVEEMQIASRSNRENMHRLINLSRPTECVSSWQFFYFYKGKTEVHSKFNWSLKYQHLYQLIFSFNTGTLDDYSCALICNLFLNNLDCVIKNQQMISYLDLNIYDIGSRIKETIDRDKEVVLSKYEFKDLVSSSEKLNKGEVSNFCFPTAFSVTDKPLYKTRKLVLSEENTADFFYFCRKNDLGVYSTVISIFNCTILKIAKELGFPFKIIHMKVLHHINTKWLQPDNLKYIFQVGSHMVPFLQYISIESDDYEDAFAKARVMEKTLEEYVFSWTSCFQEVIRQITIESSNQNYKSGMWNPKYFYSVSNLGNLDEVYSEHEQNSFYTSRYDRARSLQDDVYMDITFYVFKNKLNFYIDYSTKYVSENEIVNILKYFKKAFNTLF